MVRVPRHLINIKTNFSFPSFENVDFSLSTKWSDMARDYGNGNRTFDDEKTDDYIVNDLMVNYQIFKSYNMNFKITNLFDEKYETARDYSQLGRSFNVGIKKRY